MAALIARRCALTTVKRCLLRTPAATMATGGGIPEYYEHATGAEKTELDLLKKGEKDPFNLDLKRVPIGTKEKPIEVTSSFTKRIIGCICEEEQTHINWMWLHEGRTQRCTCGSYYQLVKVDPILGGHGGGH
ncbi:putative cytochrome c oxidase subunit 5B, mitochondrial [Apostichopus japonicus]|uniref:Putative cytochrome c oxidase subunit 5B, mitochondrial n=1 Tax=Stichopus japonicus TaxID=307972 RepID=A0A2G8LI78_STIJA|nr:putative cytochrome c oxidase subunit 5B, mitochondrial [Apostichopus japonicus]